MLASVTLNITGTHFAIAGGVVGSIVGFFIIRKVFRAIRTKLLLRSIEKRLTAQTKHDKEQVEQHDAEQRKWAHLPGPWKQLYEDCDKAAYFRLRVMLVQNFAISYSPQDVPNLSVQGANRLCKLGDSNEDVSNISDALAPFMRPARLSVKDKNGKDIFKNDKVVFGGCRYIVNKVEPRKSKYSGDADYLYVEPARGQTVANGWSIENDCINADVCRKVVGGEENLPTGKKKNMEGDTIANIAKVIETISGITKQDSNNPFNLYPN